MCQLSGLQIRHLDQAQDGELIVQVTRKQIGDPFLLLPTIVKKVVKPLNLTRAQSFRLRADIADRLPLPEYEGSDLEGEFYAFLRFTQHPTYVEDVERRERAGMTGDWAMLGGAPDNRYH